MLTEKEFQAFVKTTMAAYLELQYKMTLTVSLFPSNFNYIFCTFMKLLSCTT